MLSKIETLLRGLTALVALGVVFAYFQPWVLGPFGAIPASKLEAQLRGPGRFLSLLDSKNSLARDVQLAHYLYLVPTAAAITAITIPFAFGPAVIPLLAGSAAVIASTQVRNKVQDWPFHREGAGVGLAYRCGWILIVLSLLIWVTRRRRRAGGRARR